VLARPDNNPVRVHDESVRPRELDMPRLGNLQRRRRDRRNSVAADVQRRALSRCSGLYRGQTYRKVCRLAEVTPLLPPDIRSQAERSIFLTAWGWTCRRNTKCA
jgi:hypothetical protein